MARPGIHHYRRPVDSPHDTTFDHLRLFPRWDIATNVWWATCTDCDRTVEVGSMHEGEQWFLGHDCTPVEVARSEATAEWDDTADGIEAVFCAPWDPERATWGGLR